MRYIFLDTETTGLKTSDGNRVFEIACVEMINRSLSGREFHTVLNPQFPLSRESIKICKITDAELVNKPVFNNIVDDFLQFIYFNHNNESEQTVLIIHNAKFDLSFINNELNLAGKDHLKNLQVIDTVKIAKTKYPSSSASLDNLCKKFTIELVDREKNGHNAILDCKLLAEVFLKMCGDEDDEEILSYNNQAVEIFYGINKRKEKLQKRICTISDQEMELHERLVIKFKLIKKS